MKNKTIKNIIAVGTLALLLGVSQTASAYVPGLWDPQVRQVNPNPTFSTVVSSAYTTPVVNQNTTTTTTTTNNNNSNTVTTTSAPKQTVAKQTKTVTRNTVARSNVNNSGYNNNGFVNSNNNQGQIQGSLYPNNNGNELTALSINGSGGFMPSSLWQWMLVVLLILVIIIIARMLTRKPEHHEIHTVTAH